MLRTSTPTFDYLPWQIMHSFYVYVEFLTIASKSRLFGSMVRALDFCPGDRGSNPASLLKFSAMLYSCSTTSETEQAEEFNSQFTDVVNKSDHSEAPFLSRSAPFRDDIVVSNECVTKLLKGLNTSKALGPDELYPKVLIELATELGPGFAHLFQKVLTRVKSQKNGLLQIYVPSIKRVTGLSHVIIVLSH